MKLTLIAVGSRGDVQPVLALGVGLKRAGYHVRIVTLDSFESFVRAHGLEFWPVQGDAQELVLDMMLGPGHSSNFLTMYRGIMRSFGGIVEQYIEAFSSEVLRDSDAILNQLPGGFFGHDLAEALRVPYFALSVIPQEPTRSYPISLLPNRISFGRWWNRLTYDIATQLAWRPMRRPVDRLRERLELPKSSFWWGSTRRSAPVLQGFSEQVVPREEEWGENVFTTGYWTLDEPEWEPSSELLAFLEEDRLPIYIGFGSMPVADPQHTTQTILEALAATGQRAILSAGWAGLGEQALPPHVFLLDYAPYAWLFPQMGGLVHHGGSGTTGAAMSSGVPSCVVPFVMDQPFWGARTLGLGVGPEPIPFTKLTAEKLGAAINAMGAEPSYRQNAIRLRDKMAAEDGVQAAVDIIQQLLS